MYSSKSIKSSYLFIFTDSRHCVQSGYEPLEGFLGKFILTLVQENLNLIQLSVTLGPTLFPKLPLDPKPTHPLTTSAHVPFFSSSSACSHFAEITASLSGVEGVSAVTGFPNTLNGSYFPLTSTSRSQF